MLLLEMSELTRERTGQRREAVAPRHPCSAEPSDLSSAGVAERDAGDCRGDAATIFGTEFLTCSLWDKDRCFLILILVKI